MKKTLSILSFFLLSFTKVSAQDCDLPVAFDGNTGANMTIMLLPDLITSLNVSAPDAYLVALSADGSVVGSEEVADITQTTITIWGDDSSTSESDGALAGEAISFQLVDGDVLSEVTMPSNVSYATNGMVIQPTQASLSIICELEEVCTPNLPSPFDGNTGSNMTVMLTSPFISSLNVSASDAYLVALSADGSVVGSEEVAGISQTALSVWGDDSSTDETDGALAGEAISFQLVDGDVLFDVTAPTPVSYNTNIMVPQLAAAVLTEVLCADDDGDYLGCMDEEATNYNMDATDDDGSCIYPVPSISSDLNSGWNMIGFTGSAEKNVEEFLSENNLSETFLIIKDVSGSFWTPEASILESFVPGRGYLMFNNESPFTISFTD